MDACYCDYDPAEFYVAEMRQARKTHKCDECFKPIPPGEKYEHVRGKWDGQVDSFKACAGCLALREYTIAHVPCVCWAHGNTVEDCMETLRAYEHHCPGIVFGALREVAKAKRARAALGGEG